jgi:p-hydroxybenzoate 3-monooxygenase
VPPTGAKGLNLAASDVFYLVDGLTRFYKTGQSDGIDGYSQRALARIWQAMRFSWSLTTMMHRFPGASDYDRRMQDTELAQLERSETAQKLMAENYTGLPY